MIFSVHLHTAKIDVLFSGDQFQGLVDLTHHHTSRANGADEATFEGDQGVDKPLLVHHHAARAAATNTEGG